MIGEEHSIAFAALGDAGQHAGEVGLGQPPCSLVLADVAQEGVQVQLARCVARGAAGGWVGPSSVLAALCSAQECVAAGPQLPDNGVVQRSNQGARGCFEAQ
jgi:hypothetical protein